MTVIRLPGKRRKYNNKPGVEDGLRFDSQREIVRYRELKQLQAAGEIQDLVADKKLLKYRLEVNGMGITTYTPDFRYRQMFGEYIWGDVVEDCKSKPTKTEAYRLKKRLMKAIYGIEIVEVP